MKAGRFFQQGWAGIAGLLLSALMVGCATKPEVVTPTESPSTAVPSPTTALIPTTMSSATPAPTYTPSPTPIVIPTQPAQIPSSFSGALPEGAVARLGIGNIWDSQLSPDGSQLAVATSIGVFVYQVDPFRQVWFADSKRSVFEVAWSASGQIIVGALQNSPTFITWGASSGQQLYTATGHTDRITDISWAASGNVMASSGREGNIILWDGTTGTRLHTLARTDPGSEYFPYRQYGFNWVWFEFSPDGSMLAAGYAPGGSDTYIDNVIIIWDVESGKQLRILEDEPHFREITWSEDSRYIAAASNVWDVITGEPTTPSAVTTDWVDKSQEVGYPALVDMPPLYKLTWSPDGTMLATSSTSGSDWEHDNRVVVWNISRSKKPLEVR